ncbi:MAG: hypothetical protein CM1200mP40_08590 [Gammaproteobacteria bacterium]|nr:MAG: hypothetical protein CM1200mP40_08590 [Gammaproteobacteria bacterium]
MALVPFAFLLVRALTDNLGPDPAQELSIETGEWTLRFLLITLTLTPLRQLTGQSEFIRHRRMLGLFALFYATVHLLVWMSLILGFRWFAIAEEIVERPYITVGFTSFFILVVLGITSPKAMVRKMGKNWKKLTSLGLYRCPTRSGSFIVDIACRCDRSSILWIHYFCLTWVSLPAKFGQ